MRKLLVSVLLEGASAICLTGVAQALEVPPSSDDIVVTAQKREQRLQDVPMAVTALTARSLVDNNQVKVEDYFRSVPGLQLRPLAAGRFNLSIRGVTTGIGTSPTVGITIDDVPYG